MYRIELRPGEETVFRTIEELATGIRNGLVTPKARIYHNASQKWLPVEFHPHYKKALTMPAAKSGETPAVSGPPRASAPPPPAHTTKTPTSKAPTSGLVFVHVEYPEPAVAMASAAVAVAVAVAVASPVVALPTIAYEEEETELEPAVEEHPAPVAHASVARSRIGRPRPLHLGAAAAVLIVGTYVAVSAASPARKAATEPAPSLQTVQPAPSEPEPPSSIVAAASVDSIPAKVIAAAAPKGTGPTFGGPPAPAAPKRPMTASIGSSPRAPAAADSSAIEPPPTEVDISIPSLPRGDSLAPTSTTDSNAMRRILRAVGGKGAPATPAQP